MDLATAECSQMAHALNESTITPRLILLAETHGENANSIRSRCVPLNSNVLCAFVSVFCSAHKSRISRCQTRVKVTSYSAAVWPASRCSFSEHVDVFPSLPCDSFEKQLWLRERAHRQLYQKGLGPH